VPDRLRLCFLTRRWVAEIAPGGVAVWTQALAAGLAARGHAVSVVTGASSTPSTDIENGVAVHRIAPNRDASTPDLLAGAPAELAAFSIAAAAEVARIQAARSLDLVSGPISDLEPAACLAAGLVPTVVSLHTTRAVARDGETPDHEVSAAIAAETALLRAAPLALANSRAIEADVRRLHPGALARADIAFVPHGLADLAAGAALNTGGDDRRRLLFVGRLETRKGADVALDALALLLPDRPELEADVIGDDDPVGPPVRVRFLERWAGAPWLARVRFWGALPRARLPERYAAADIVLAPSRYESFGLAVAEAMMFAKPVIAARAGAAPEVIADGATGLLVPAGDAWSLARAAAALLDDPARARALGAAGRRRFETELTLERMVERVEKVFGRWVAQKRSA
jgi:glycosyltransferase involved in cell wall biosynthesis